MTRVEHPGLNFWMKASADRRSAVSQRLSAIVAAHAETFVDTFYSTFLRDPEASAFLSHSVVTERLSSSLHRWLLDLVATDPLGELDAFNARQVKVGEIHSRLKIPNHLVMEGLTLIRGEIANKVAELDINTQAMADTLIMLSEIIDYAQRLMTSAYMSNTTRRAQTDEAFRLFSLGQDIHLERETQRAALMEWSQSVLFAILGHNSAPPTNLGASPFGLWVRHRAGVLFQGSTQLTKIEAIIRTIDNDVLSTVSSDQANAVVELQKRIDEIKYLLNDIFTAATNLENGRDPLTRALNRRFLPSVLGREISLANRASTPLSILMVDIDHFKALNDTHGHSAGDTVLSHTADVLLNAVRPSDFVFRYGGEEFLIVLVETDEVTATEIAERIRHKVSEETTHMNDMPALRVTVSIGVAGFEGHPDYQYLINAADEALYRAKNNGRNRVAA